MRDDRGPARTQALRPHAGQGGGAARRGAGARPRRRRRPGRGRGDPDHGAHRRPRAARLRRGAVAGACLRGSRSRYRLSRSAAERVRTGADLPRRSRPRHGQPGRGRRDTAAPARPARGDGVQDRRLSADTSFFRGSGDAGSARGAARRRAHPSHARFRGIARTRRLRRLRPRARPLRPRRKSSA